MERILRILIPWFVAAAALSGQTLSLEQRLADLDQVVNNVPQLHPDLFANVSQETFQAAVDQLRSDNPRLSAVAFYSRVAALLALAGDAHTRLTVWTNGGARLGFVYLPILVRCFSDGVYVISAPQDHLEWLGARVVSINGVPVADAVARLEPLISHENEYCMRNRMPGYLTTDGFLRGVGLVEPGQLARFGLLLANGESVEVELSPNTPATRTEARAASAGHAPSYTQNPDWYYWSEYRADSRTLYIRYDTCLDQEGRPFSAFVDDTLALLDGNPTETILFDLRENSGGTSNFLNPLIQGVAARLPRLRENPDFRVYTIIDGGTFSAGSTAAEFLRVTDEYAPKLSLGDVGLASLLVGEPTGNKPTHFGQPPKFALERSRLNVYCSSKKLQKLPWTPDLDAVYPDVQWQQHSTDYFTRHDAWRALAQNRVSRLPAPPEGDVIVVNAASLRPEHGLAPGSFAIASGDFPEGPLEIRVDGRRADIYEAARTRIRFRVPADVAAGMVPVEVRDAQGTVKSGRVEVSAAALALFVENNADMTQPGKILNEDNRLNGRDNPARKGSVIQVFGTGNANGANPVVWIADRKTSVSSSAMTAEGLWQINAKVPEDAPAGVVPVYVAAGGLVSNAVTIIVE